MKGLYMLTNPVLRELNAIKLGMSMRLEERLYDYEKFCTNNKYIYCYSLDVTKEQILYLEKIILQHTCDLRHEMFSTEYRIFNKLNCVKYYHNIIVNYLKEFKVTYEILQNPTFPRPIHKVISEQFDMNDITIEYDPFIDVKSEKKIINKPIKTYTNITHTYEKINVNMINDFINILDVNKRSQWKPWANIMLLLRNFGLIDIAHEFSKKMAKYDANEVNRLFSTAPVNHTLGIGSLKYWAKEDNPEEYEKLIQKYQTYLTYNNIYDDILLKDYKSKINIIENTERITEKAIEKIINAKTSIVMSCTGSGKTTMIKNCIIDACPNNSIISISCIRSLAKAQEVDLGLTSYLNGKVDNRTIISYEQITKRAAPYDIVILDEVTSLLKHIKSTTMKKKRDCHKCLMEIVKNAKRLIACDAIMTDVVYEFIKNCRGDDILFYQNTYKRWSGITVNIVEANNEKIKTDNDEKPEYKDKSTEFDRIKTFLTPLMKELKDGKTCAIVSDSKGYITKSRDIIMNYLIEHEIMSKEEAEKYISIFTSDHGKLENINSKYFKSHCIMFSPKIVFGVNIDESVKYESESIYVIYKGTSIDCTAMLQQLGRFRGAKGIINLLWVRKNYTEQKNKYISPEEVKERELVKINSYIKASKEINEDMEIIKELGCNYTPDKGYEINDDCVFSKQYFRECWYDEILTTNKNQPLISLLEFYGYNITHAMLDVQHKTKNLKKCVEINDKEEIRNNCMKYLNYNLSKSHNDYELIRERIDKKLLVLGYDRESLMNNEEEYKRQIIIDIVIDEEIYKYCIKSTPLFLSDEELKNKFKNFDIYKTIDMKNKNPATIAVINKIEKIAEIKRFDHENINAEHFNDIKKYLDENKLLIGDALYGFSGISKKLRENSINIKLEEIKTIEDVGELLIHLYNQLAPFYKKQIKNKICDGKHIREYKSIKNDETYKHINVFRKIVDYAQISHE